MNQIKQGNMIKLYNVYDNLETALKRKPILESSIKNTINRENKEKGLNREFIDSQISLKEDGKYLLTMFIKN